MILSPLWRGLCLALVSGGLLQVAFEFAGWWISWKIPAANGPNPRFIRRQERLLLLLMLGSRVGSWLLVLCALIPAYLHAEDNRSGERVGLLCLGLACIVFCWWVITLLRFLVTLLRTLKLYRACRSAHTTALGLPGSMPILLHPLPQPLIAMAGIFHPRLVVSSHLLQRAWLSAEALEIAFAHEIAHARQFDNLKLLLLALLPHLPFASKAQPSLITRWRLVAELAADRDSTGGERTRSLLLADVLVALARQHRISPSRAGVVALLSEPDHLYVRVEHLLRETSSSEAAPRTQSNLGLCLSGMLLFSSAGSLCIYFGHRIAELLLHLG